MKIGIVHTAYLQKGGEDIAVEQECYFLKDKKCQVSLLLFRNPGNKWRRFGSFCLSVFNPRSWIRINRWIREECPDIIHIHNWHFSASPSVIRAAKKRGIPVVHTLHNYRLLCPSATLLHNNKLFLESLRPGFPWPAVFKRVYHRSFLQTFWLSLTIWLHKVAGTWKNIDKYIVLTDFARGLVLSSGILLEPHRLAVKPNFIPDISLEPSYREDYFLFVGRLSEEKGIEVMLQAFAGSTYRLRIIGDGPLQHLVRKYATQNPNIRYEGFQEREFILKALKHCTAMIFPSICYEGNPISIIESLACGTPVIASRLGAMEVMIRDGFDGFHFEPGNSKDLLNKIKLWQALAPQEKSCFYAHARQTYQQNYTPERNMELLLSIYRQVIDHQ